MTAFLICDWVENHPSCINGEAYFRPSAVLFDKAVAEKLVAQTNEARNHSSRVCKMFELEKDVAVAAYDARRFEV